MKTMKSFAALALVCVLGLTLLTGCSGKETSLYGETLTDSFVNMINNVRPADQELKNNKKIQRELNIMLDEIDAETGEIDGEEAFRLNMKQDGINNTKVEVKMVLTADIFNKYNDLLDDENRLDVNLLKDIAMKYKGTHREAQILDATASEAATETFSKLFVPIAPSMDSFAVSYRVMKGGKLYIAIGFSALAQTDAII